MCIYLRPGSPQVRVHVLRSARRTTWTRSTAVCPCEALRSRPTSSATSSSPRSPPPLRRRRACVCPSSARSSTCTRSAPKRHGVTTRLMRCSRRPRTTCSPTAALLRRPTRKQSQHTCPDTDLHLPLAILRTLVKEFLAAYHGTTVAGHLGFKKALPRLLRECQNVLRAGMRLANAPAAPLDPETRPTSASCTQSLPWEMLGMDILNPLRTRRGYAYMIVFMDYLSLRERAAPSRSPSTAACPSAC